MMAFFFLLLIAVVAYAAGWRPQFGQWGQPASPASGGSGDNAREILRERYARGEITRAEYQDMRDELSR